MNSRKSGLLGTLDGGLNLVHEKVLLPFFFLGTISEPGPNYSSPIKATSPAELKIGQYFVSHQYEGHACSHAGLYGIFFPISTCSNKALANALIAISKKYYGEDKCALHPYRDGTQPVLPGIREVRSDFDALGLAAKVADLGFPNGTAEALIRFESIDDVILWLKRENLKYICEVEDDADSFRIKELCDLLFSSATALADWLAITDGSRLQAAFVYENSD